MMSGTCSSDHAKEMHREQAPTFCHLQHAGKDQIIPEADSSDILCLDAGTDSHARGGQSLP
jgi:hypothetical protein